MGHCKSPGYRLSDSILPNGAYDMPKMTEVADSEEVVLIGTPSISGVKKGTQMRMWILSQTAEVEFAHIWIMIIGVEMEPHQDGFWNTWPLLHSELFELTYPLKIYSSRVSFINRSHDEQCHRHAQT